MLYGEKDILRKLNKYESAGTKATERGVKKAAIATASHVQREYNRPATGKGFGNVSGLLRSSIRGVVIHQWGKIIGYVIAGWGGVREGKKSYAHYVEFRWGGKYAYMWPGVKDMKKEIKRLIKNEIKGIIK